MLSVTVKSRSTSVMYSKPVRLVSEAFPSMQNCPHTSLRDSIPVRLVSESFSRISREYSRFKRSIW